MGLLARVAQLWQKPPASLTVLAGLDYARQPEPGWQAALDAATRSGDGVSRLWLQWVPGDPWQPVHRWLVFQLQPWAGVPAAIQRELRGPHPRTGAALTYIKRVIGGKLEMRPALRGGPCRMIDRLQWVVHRDVERRTGMLTFPRYFWAIQGLGGGHPFMLGSEEQALRAAQGVPDVPSIGDLAYAPFDARVVQAIRRYDLWKYAHGLGDPVTAYAATQIARQTEIEREANRLVWGRKEAVAHEIADELSHAARKDGLHYHRWRPVGQKDRAVDFDRMRERYISETSFD